MVLIDDTSDHLPCLTMLPNLIRSNRHKQKIKTRSLKHLSRVQDGLRNVDWSILEDDRDVNTQTDFFLKKLTTLLDAHCPEKEFEVSYKTLRREPWMTKGLMNSMKRSKELYKQSLQKNTTNEDIRDQYKNYRNIFSKLKRFAKINYYNSKCEEYRNNTSKLWKVINNITGKISNKSDIIDHIKIKNVRCYSSQLIANEFGEFFSSIGRTYAQKIPKAQFPINHYVDKIKMQPKSIFLTPTNRTELENLISKLPNKSSCGHDNINNILLKKLGSEILTPLTIICNTSLSTGVFPRKMKTAIVIPLYKSKERELVNNYRPISLLMTISKILEKVVYKRVYNFMQDTQQIYTSQYGFRAGHSCESAISEVLGEIAKSLQNGKTTICILLDLSKAFDSLEHNVIFDKMEKYGLRGTCLDWFKSYLTDRDMRVKCRTRHGTDILSDTYKIDYGTAQGSCLGPLIFMIFCNDLRLNLEYLKSIQFADDSTLMKSHKNLRYLTFCIENDLNLIQDWFNTNKLTLNVDKTVCMVFSPRPIEKPVINLSGITLPVVPCSKFLGLWIDSKLSWGEHIRKLITRLHSRLGLLKRSKRLLSVHARRCLYYAQIHSILTYGILLWGNMISLTQINKLQKLQNVGVQLIDPMKSLPEIYADQRILTIENVVKLENSKIWYRYYHGLVPTRLHQLMTEDSNKRDITKLHNYNTRQKNELNMPLATGHYKNSFFVKGMKDYSKLPYSVKNTLKLSHFINKCKGHLLAEQ